MTSKDALQELQVMLFCAFALFYFLADEWRWSDRRSFFFLPSQASSSKTTLVSCSSSY